MGKRVRLIGSSGSQRTAGDPTCARLLLDAHFPCVLREAGWGGLQYARWHHFITLVGVSSFPFSQEKTIFSTHGFKLFSFHYNNNSNCTPSNNFNCYHKILSQHLNDATCKTTFITSTYYYFFSISILWHKQFIYIYIVSWCIGCYEWKGPIYNSCVSFLFFLPYCLHAHIWC